MIQFRGLAHKTALFFQKEQLTDPVLWKRFVEVYRVQQDGSNQGWRGEYWGKTIRCPERKHLWGRRILPAEH